MPYDPFARGEHPVGVRTGEYVDALSGRGMPFELWYPAAAALKGRDLDDASCDRFQVAPGLPVMKQAAIRDAVAAPGARPLVLYFHGGYGDRRESSHLLTHLASHGYAVAAPAFAGDSFLDTLPGPGGERAAMATTPVDESARRRPRQASSFLDVLLSSQLPAGVRLDAGRIAVAGYSLGGFTALAFNSSDRRASAVFALCPMYGRRSLLPQVRRLQGLLDVQDWGRPVPTLVLSGDLDPMVNVEDMRDLYQRLAPPKRLVIVGRAGHLHWTVGAAEMHERYRLGYLSGEFPDPEVDGPALAAAMRPMSELCSEEQAAAAARAAFLAQVDAFLRGDPDARDWLDHALARALKARGVEVETAM